ncbi:unnamed protein product [Prunus armeniaca]|uniref:Uncharacterized protein n=1 Tax=Prunus armeniaca TaxID=36596 RepID=A0A6J5U110_PRUAR|nr:hypothetical protein GBA52_007690 [Prunus armeniaca]CAB4269662.1 unnamed protein product [Prunus armeniaca]
MSQADMQRPVLTFVFGAMFGAFITRPSPQCCHCHHDHEGRKHPPGLLQAIDNKKIGSNQGVEVTTIPSATPGMEN